MILFPAPSYSCLLSTAFGQIFGGRRSDRHAQATLKTLRIAYTAYPPSQLRSSAVANRDVDAAGPSARAADARNCATPFTAPSERLFGADDETYKKIAPGAFVLSFCFSIKSPPTGTLTEREVHDDEQCELREHEGPHRAVDPARLRAHVDRRKHGVG